MSLFFSASLLVPKQKSQSSAGKHTAAVGPVVYCRNQKAEQEDTDSPAAYLSINCLTVNPTPAFAKIQGGTDKAAYCCRGANGKGYSSQVGHKEAENTA